MTTQNFPGYIPALTDADASVRAYARRLLGIPGEGDVVPFLVEWMESADTPTRRAASGCLCDLADSAPVAILLRAMKDDDAGVRANAARALGDAGVSDATPLLHVALAQDSDRSVRANAVAALGKIQDGAAFIELVEGPLSPMTDSSRAVRLETARALRLFAEPRAIPFLVAAIDRADETDEVRIECGRALAGMGAREAVPAFVSALEVGQPPCRSWRWSSSAYTAAMRLCLA